MKYQTAAECVSCEVEGGIAILDLKSNTYFSLDPVGATIWAHMSTPASLDQLADAVAAEYAVAADACRDDISDLLKDLLKHGLIQSS